MPELTDAQRKELARIERDSYIRLCAELGVDPDAYQRTRSQQLDAYLARLRSAVTDVMPDGVSGLNEAIDSVNESDAAARFGRIRDEAHRETLAQFLPAIDRLPIHWTYLESLAENIGFVTHGSDRRKWLEELLLFLPHVDLCDREFNAFVTATTIVKGVPAICRYDYLDYTCASFLEFMTGRIAYWEEDGLTLLTQSDIRSLATAEPTLAKCTQLLRLLRGDGTFAPDPSDLASDRWPKVHLYVMAARLGAVDFVYFHELGHLLLGYLERGPCHAVEFEADQFAWEVLHLLPRCRHQLRPWYEIGALSVLTLIALIGFLEHNVESPTHPAGLLRALAIARTLRHDSARWVIAVQEAILIMSAPALESLGGIQYHVEARCLEP